MSFDIFIEGAQKRERGPHLPNKMSFVPKHKGKRGRGEREGGRGKRVGNKCRHAYASSFSLSPQCAPTRGERKESLQFLFLFFIQSMSKDTCRPLSEVD